MQGTDRPRPPTSSHLSDQSLSPLTQESHSRKTHFRSFHSKDTVLPSEKTQPSGVLPRRATSNHDSHLQPHRFTPCPLKRATTSHHAFARRPSALSTRESSMSRASSLAPSPLDDIPEALWDRTLLRTTSAIESRPVDFSIEEITDTRMSLDDQAMLGLLQRCKRRPNHQQPSVMQRAFCGIWGGTSDRFKSMKKRVRDFPRGIFTRTQSAPCTLPMMHEPLDVSFENEQDTHCARGTTEDLPILSPSVGANPLVMYEEDNRSQRQDKIMGPPPTPTRARD